MSSKSSFYSRPFKFVVVGELGSGKSTLINTLLSGFKGEEYNSDWQSKSTFVCDGHSLSLTTTAKLVCRDGTSVALTSEDITRQLWRKNFSKSAKLPHRLSTVVSNHGEIAWDDIFVYLHRPKKRTGTRSRLQSEPNNSNSNRNEKLLGTALKKPTCSMLRKNVYNPGGRCVFRKKYADSRAVDLDVDVWDTGGDKSLMWYRWYACTGADAVLLCVPLFLILSFNAALNEQGTSNGECVVNTLKKFLSDEFLCNKSKKLDYRIPPVLLVGTKSDQCDMVTRHSRSFADDDGDVVDSIGLNLAAELGCCDFVYCSGLRGNGVTSVFETALAVSLTSDGKYRASAAKHTEGSPVSDEESSLEREVLEPTYFKVHSSDIKSDGGRGTTNAPKNSNVLQKPPPVIYFPPPPDYSPPSSGSSPRDSTDSSVSREPTPEQRVLSSSKEPGNSALQNKEQANEKFFPETFTPVRGEETIPTPKPRTQKLPRLGHSDPALYSLSPQLETSQRADIVDKAVPKPVPKPRKLFDSPKRQKNIVFHSRKEELFVKFLKS